MHLTLGRASRDVLGAASRDVLEAASRDALEAASRDTLGAAAALILSYLYIYPAALDREEAPQWVAFLLLH